MSGRTRDQLLEVAAAALGQVSTGEAEVVAVEHDSQLTRFANNTIHQNVAEQALQLRVRLIADGRVGVAERRGEAEGSLQQVVRSAVAALQVGGSSNPSPLPAPDGGADAPVAFSSDTKASSPEQRATLAAEVVDAARRSHVLAYGSMSTSTTRTAVVNSAGLRRFAESTQAGLTAVVRGDDGAGYAARHAAGVGSIDGAELAGEAVDTCLRNQHATAVEPGRYEVVLSPYAVTDLVEHLAWLGFSALAKQEQRSFMRPGERLMSDAVTIADDPHDSEIFPFPFDSEGVSTRRVVFVEDGVCSGFMYDTPTALVDGVESTGHSLPQPNTWGPFARHLSMSGGDSTPDELIAAVRNGLYVTRLWYVRDVHPLRTIITGMTREGTFRIENGKLSTPVRDLRFTQSIVDALADVRGVSGQRRLALSEEAGAVLTPWLHLGHFTFTS